MFRYPTEEELRWFTKTLQSESFTISKYLPPLSEDWYESVMDCIDYAKEASRYEENNDIYEESAKILYKVVKKHELADANKRSSLIAMILFCLVNDYFVVSPNEIKKQAKRLARTKGRQNEMIMRKRVAKILKEILEYRP